MTSDEVKPTPRPVSGTDRKRTMLIVSVIVIATMVSLGAIYWLVQYDVFNRNGTFTHHYLVRVEANTTGQYVLRLPVPNDVEGRLPAYFMEDLVVLMGQPVFALAEYQYGHGIEIRASGYSEFEWTKVWPESWKSRYGNLTMTTGAEGWSSSEPCNSWVYSDRTDIRIIFSYSSIHRYLAAPMFASGGGPTYHFHEYPNGTGWQQMPVDYGWMLIN